MNSCSAFIALEPAWQVNINKERGIILWSTKPFCYPLSIKALLLMSGKAISAVERDDVVTWESSGNRAVCPRIMGATSVFPVLIAKSGTTPRTHSVFTNYRPPRTNYACYSTINFIDRRVSAITFRYATSYSCLSPQTRVTLYFGQRCACNW
jgi:hypothetical protein